MKYLHSFANFKCTVKDEMIELREASGRERNLREEVSSDFSISILFNLIFIFSVIIISTKTTVVIASPQMKMSRWKDNRRWDT